MELENIFWGKRDVGLSCFRKGIWDFLVCIENISIMHYVIYFVIYIVYYYWPYSIFLGGANLPPSPLSKKLLKGQYNVIACDCLWLNCLKVFQCKYIKIYQNMSKYILISSNLSEYIIMYPNISYYIQIYPNIS